MKVPLFQSLLDIQNLSRIYPEVSFTQTVHLHIKNNQLELPISTTLHVTDNSTITDDFLRQLDQLLNVYETTLFAIVVQTKAHTFARRLFENDEELVTVGTDDKSTTHFVLSIKITDSILKKTSLLPVTRTNPPGYRPALADQLETAMLYFNQHMPVS